MAARDEAYLASANEAYRLARLLRHEVGDLLQSVYSTVGILLERLPDAFALERRLVGDLKTRAELCKLELDGVVELVGPPVAQGRTDLMIAVQMALLQARRRFPNLHVHFDACASALVAVDGRALSASVGLLFLAVCQGAQKQLQVRVQMHEDSVECTLQRDGYPTTAEQLAWLRQPFATTQHALFGVALALAGKVIQSSGGEVSAANLPEGGISIRLRIPAAKGG